MYMNLKPNKHKRISFNTTTMTLGFIAPLKFYQEKHYHFTTQIINQASFILVVYIENE